MKFILAGEGSSDLGTTLPDGTLKKGAMTLLVDAIADKCCSMMPDYHLVSESELKSLKKQDRRNTMGRGKEHKPYEEVFLSAQYLGKYSKTVFPDEEQAGVVFFKDSDGTNAAPKKRWESNTASRWFHVRKAKHGSWGIFKRIFPGSRHTITVNVLRICREMTAAPMR